VASLDVTTCSLQMPSTTIFNPLKVHMQSVVMLSGSRASIALLAVSPLAFISKVSDLSEAMGIAHTSKDPPELSVRELRNNDVELWDEVLATCKW
jgi:hypothetical protein